MPSNVSVPPAEPDAHLVRLLVETEQAWYVSLVDNLKWLFSPKQPPLQVTSTPVPLKEIWGEYRYGKVSAPLSLLIHGVVVALLIASGRIAVTQGKKIIQRQFFPVTISAYLPPLSPEQVRAGGGGGGDRSPDPASLGRLPRFSNEQFTPPAVVIRNENPKLAMEATVIVPPDINLPQPNVPHLGDPMGAVGGPPSSGPGSGGGIGTGAGGGVGPGRGPGVGPGEGGGISGAYMPGGGITSPQLIYQVEPDFTDEARRARHQGTVVLQGVVEADGRIHNMIVVSSLGMGLDDRAIQAVRQWKFKPGTKNGQPVPVWARIEVTFRLL